MQAHPQSIPAALIPLLAEPFPGLSRVTPPLSEPLVRRLMFSSVAQSALGLSTVPQAVGEPGAGALALLAGHPGPVCETAGLAHDAGNLLGALGLYCELLGAPGVLRPEHRHYAAELGLISARSAALISRLLTPPSVSAEIQGRASANSPRTASIRCGDGLQHEAGAQPLTHAATLRELAPVLERIAAGSARVVVSVPAALPAVELAAEALERITVNLVRNAAQAIHNQQLPPGSGQIRVMLGVLAGRLQLMVEDNGPGMSPRMAAAFLQPAAEHTRMARGLGHRIVHELLASSGGQLSIRSRPGLGTVFCLKWPLMEAPAPLATAVPETVTSETVRSTEDDAGNGQIPVYPTTLINHVSRSGAAAQEGQGKC